MLREFSPLQEIHSILLSMLFSDVFLLYLLVLLIILWLSYLVSCTELIKQSLVDDSKIGEAVRPYVERKMMGKHVHKYNNLKKNLLGG